MGTLHSSSQPLGPGCPLDAPPPAERLVTAWDGPRGLVVGGPRSTLLPPSLRRIRASTLPSTRWARYSPPRSLGPLRYRDRRTMMPAATQRYRVGTATIELTRGDIVEQDVDAIVNAANEELAAGGPASTRRCCVTTSPQQRGLSCSQHQWRRGRQQCGMAAVTPFCYASHGERRYRTTLQPRTPSSFPAHERARTASHHRRSRQRSTHSSTAPFIPAPSQPTPNPTFHHHPSPFAPLGAQLIHHRTLLRTVRDGTEQQKPRQPPGFLAWWGALSGAARALCRNSASLSGDRTVCL